MCLYYSYWTCIKITRKELMNRMRSGLLDNICNPANAYFTYSIWLFNEIYREENPGKKVIYRNIYAEKNNWISWSRKFMMLQ